MGTWVPKAGPQVKLRPIHLLQPHSSVPGLCTPRGSPDPLRCRPTSYPVTVQVPGFLELPGG